MSYDALIANLEKEQIRKDYPAFQIGDSLAISLKIVEGDKSRTQLFTGTLIGRKGSGVSENIVLHRVAHGEGMERLFALHSPVIEKIEVVRTGQARRAKLYYLRGTQGKKAKVRGRIVSRKKEATA